MEPGRSRPHLDVTPAAASQFESGVTRPGTDALDRMTSALGVPDEFFSLPVTETHDGFFRSLRRTSVSHRRRARALAHIAHDLAQTARGTRTASSLRTADTRHRPGGSPRAN